MIALRDPVTISTRLLGDFGHTTIGLVFPEQCLFCGSQSDGSIGTLERSEHNGALCDSCQSLFVNDDRSPCLKCGCPVGPFLPAPQRCLKCQRATYHFHEVVRLGIYRDELREAVIQGKASANRALCLQLGRLLVRAQRERLEMLNADLVVSVPSHWLKRLFVPHHQAEVLAQCIADEMKLPFRGTCLKKTRMTADQSDLSREKRKQNLSQAFRVTQPQLVRDRTVLLVDDVMTTRTTANECAQALRKAGARRVIAVAIAVVE